MFHIIIQHSTTMLNKMIFQHKKKTKISQKNENTITRMIENTLDSKMLQSTQQCIGTPYNIFPKKDKKGHPTKRVIEI